MSKIKLPAPLKWRKSTSNPQCDWEITDGKQHITFASGKEKLRWFVELVCSTIWGLKLP